MVPRTQARKPRNSSKINLIISVVFHGLIVVALVYFAAREGVLGKQLKKLAVSMVKEKPPEKPKEQEKPKEDVPKDIPKLAVTPKMSAPKDSAPPPITTTVAPPVSAPPAVEMPSFSFGGGRDVETADANTVYKGQIESSLKAKWNRPEDLQDRGYVAEVDIQVDKDGQLSSPVWKKGSGNQRWDDSVKAALAATKSLDLPPPKNFPSHVLVRFDVTEEAEPIMP
ncbi:MAG TPA: energy transducer TonB [Verrucomicrobiae bacterium]|jgi:hypothetical protein|nr:energy transducer TonB [Verrucomicrobiae bacterium]